MDFKKQVNVDTRGINEKYFFTFLTCTVSLHPLTEIPVRND